MQGLMHPRTHAGPPPALLTCLVRHPASRTILSRWRTPAFGTLSLRQFCPTTHHSAATNLERPNAVVRLATPPLSSPTHVHGDVRCTEVALASGEAGCMIHDGRSSGWKDRILVLSSLFIQPSGRITSLPASKRHIRVRQGG